MANAEISETVDADFERLYQAITDYARYPEFVDGMKSARVESREGSKVVVTYHLSMMKDIRYTLQLTEDKEKGLVSWTLKDSDFFKTNTGRWELQAEGKKTRVKYSLDVEFKISVPGFILKKLVKTSLGSMVRSFEKRAQSL